MRALAMPTLSSVHTSFGFQVQDSLTKCTERTGIKDVKLRQHTIGIIYWVGAVSDGDMTRSS